MKIRLFALFMLLSSGIACQHESAPANKDNAGTQSGIIYHSSDGGKTWEDISTGLHDSLKPNSLSVHEGELWLGASDGLYRGTRYIHRDNLGKNTARRPGNWAALRKAGKAGTLFHPGMVSFRNFPEQVCGHPCTSTCRIRW
jgi:hypothetical protein